MTIGSILLGAALIVLVGLFLARPFLLSNAQYGRQKSRRQELLAQKEAVMAQIQILEFDYETGTLPEQDFEQRRQQLVAEAAEILQKLDELPGTTSGRKVDGEIEAAVARLRQPRQTASAPVKSKAKAKAALQPSAPVPAAVKTAAPANGRIKFCTQCGQSIEKGDNFCAYCGHQIIPAQAA